MPARGENETIDAKQNHDMKKHSSELIENDPSNTNSDTAILNIPEQPSSIWENSREGGEGGSREESAGSPKDSTRP
jgi:hypothetical protein